MIATTEGQPMPGFSDSVREAFSPKGVLAKSSDFEYRPQQQELAVAVAEALTASSPLVAEAGTGVGKSLAYLLPAARFALDTGRKGVISTHTINLQEQLVRKDIPIVRKLVGHELPTVLLKGRQNYLCPQRLRRAFDQSGDLFTSTETTELEAIRTCGCKCAARRTSARRETAARAGTVFSRKRARPPRMPSWWW
jgi:ATP-dependent DNA helicase DinG